MAVTNRQQAPPPEYRTDRLCCLTTSLQPQYHLCNFEIALLLSTVLTGFVAKNSDKHEDKVPNRVFGRFHDTTIRYAQAPRGLYDVLGGLTVAMAFRFRTLDTDQKAVRALISTLKRAIEIK